MAVQITIIGLGQVGTSVGLALAAHTDQVTRLGHDIQAGSAHKALKLGAIDKVHYNLPSAVAEADIVLLALPLDQIRETLEIIARDVKADAVVMDTAPAKTAVSAWVRELLPEKRHYVGLAPVFSPLYLHEQTMGIAAARADLFQKGLMAIAAPPGTPGGALKLAADLSTLLGAQPFFVDLAEVDGMMAAAHLLPQLSAAALAEMLTGQPGWPDIRKVTGRPFAAATDAAIFQDGAAGLGEAAMHNRANTLRLLDELIAHLAALRADIANEEADSLKNRLAAARAGQWKWWEERSAGDWLAVERGSAVMQTSGAWKQQLGALSRLFEPRRKRGEANREGAKTAPGH
jgi:prephenate dehydrogenase